jgi:chromosomal replication initiation ATPase DnaA
MSPTSTTDDPVLDQMRTEIRLLENRLAALRSSITQIEKNPRPASVDPVVEMILGIVAKNFGCSVADIFRRSKEEQLIWSRHTAVHLIRQILNWSTPKIGRFFDRDHAAILNSLKRVQDRRSTDPSYEASLIRISVLIEAQAPRTP